MYNKKTKQKAANQLRNSKGMWPGRYSQHFLLLKHFLFLNMLCPALHGPGMSMIQGGPGSWALGFKVAKSKRAWVSFGILDS